MAQTPPQAQRVDRSRWEALKEPQSLTSHRAFPPVIRLPSAAIFASPMRQARLQHTGARLYAQPQRPKKPIVCL
eukprot:CAMPEP_0115829856 /NCGR_PEP_ID=MMETSP0287-20121206/1314_1 /TAXON_ID=412157 /ORGANISM="Chrysochromulina rotalis, Strain UIO044" /LENGTH=73 /DNA_ID=CAMNT_0003283135 /DNA_START=374 /DNA_END=596 /DNA_ORIENTATION=+